MRGISAKSLDEVLAAVSAAGTGSGDLGVELFDVVATLDREPALRRVLTDPSTEAEARQDSPSRSSAARSALTSSPSFAWPSAAAGRRAVT